MLSYTLKQIVDSTEKCEKVSIEAVAKFNHVLDVINEFHLSSIAVQSTNEERQTQLELETKLAEANKQARAEQVKRLKKESTEAKVRLEEARKTFHVS